MNLAVLQVIAIGGSFIFMIALATYCVLVAIEKEFGHTVTARTLDDVAAAAVQRDRQRIANALAWMHVYAWYQSVMAIVMDKEPE
jgi:hypothetical protein